jgi:hypothetical protein
MTIAFNDVPPGYDIDFIARHCDIVITGREQLLNGATRITYRSTDGSGSFDKVSQTIENYAVEYLPVALEQKISQISDMRANKIKEFTFMGMLIELDLEAKTNLVGAVAGLDRNPNVPGLDWSLGGGVFIFLPRQIVYMIADASFLYIEGCFTTARTLGTQCKACQNINELAAVDINSGWPQGT